MTHDGGVALGATTSPGDHTALHNLALYSVCSEAPNGTSLDTVQLHQLIAESRWRPPSRHDAVHRLLAPAQHYTKVSMLRHDLQSPPVTGNHELSVISRKDTSWAGKRLIN
jgi:hypothetical protein